MFKITLYIFPFISGFLPDIWLIGSIKPIYKNKGNPLDSKNFPPITILSCLGKMFTAILNERLRVFSEEVFFRGKPIRIQEIILD
jgi:small basic protein